MRILSTSCVALAAVSVLGVSVNASTLQEALKGGSVNGEVRSTTVYSTDVSSAAYSEAVINNNANSGAIGLQLNYESGDYHGFKANVGFQSATDLDIDDKSDSSPVTGENEPRSTVEGASMYVANIQYNTAKTTIKAGKQIIMTPLIANSNTFTLRDSFNAISVDSKDIENTNIKFYAIRDWYERYHIEDSSRITHFEDPAYSFYVKSQATKELTLEAQILAVTDSVGAPTEAPVKMYDEYSTYFLTGTYKLPTATPLSVGAYYAGASYDQSGEEDTNMVGLKLGGKAFNTGFKVAYTKVDDDNNFAGALGHVPHFFKYNGGQMFTDYIYAGMTSTSLLLVPDFGIAGFKALLSYSAYSQSDAGQTVSGHDMDGASEIQADLRYNFGNGFSTRYQIAMIDYDVASASDSELTTSRLYLNYKF